MIIGIDIGGTEIKYGVVSQTGELLFTSSMPTEREQGAEHILSKIDQIIHELRTDKTLGVGLSVAGLIDTHLGKIIGGPKNIPNWIGTNLREIIKQRHRLPVMVDNDVNCATIGECWLGAGKNEKDFLMLAIGTGIGGGIVLNGELLRGVHNVSGEFGHMPLIKNGVPCGCGSKGCYERYASTSALIKMVKDQLGVEKRGSEIFAEVHKNNPDYVAILDTWIDYLTDGLAILLYIFNPKLILIGGGISKQGDFLLQKIFASLKNKIPEIYTKNLQLKIAKNGNYAGVLGAVYLLLKQINQ